MSRAAFGLASLLAACSTGTPGAPSAPPPSGTPAPDLRFPDKSTPAPEPEPPPAVAAVAIDTRLIGVLHRMGERTCPDGQYGDTWVREHWAVGFVPLHTTPAQDEALMALRGKPVLVAGATAEGPPALPEAQVAPCPAMQMRSDWVDSPDGILKRRGEPPLRGLKLAEARAWTALRAGVVADKLALTLEHDFGEAPLKDARLVVHYEGCYGKPGTESHVFEFKEIARRGGAGAAAPLHKGMPQRDHVASSVEVQGTAEGVLVALDVPLGALGVTPPDCPSKQLRSIP